MTRCAATVLAMAVLAAVGALPAQGRSRLAAELEAIVTSAPRSVKLGVAVSDCRTNRSLYQHRAKVPLVPASNMKLLTAAAVLDRLGPDFVHETRLVLAGTRTGPRQEGALWIVGGGDPTISRRFDADPLLDELAAAMAATGVREIAGDLIVDARAFDDQRLHPAWERSDAEHWYGAEVSALSLNDNCIDVAVGGGSARPGVSLLPDTRYASVDLRAQLIPSSKGHVFSILRTGADKRTLRITGKVWRKAKPYTSSVPVTDPALFFATVLRERLEARGIRLTGGIRRAAAGEQATGLTVWTRKAPLPRTLEVLNQRSQNLYAECLIKTLGRLQEDGSLGSEGSWERGAKEIAAHARAQRVPSGELTVSDGSGLSRENACSPRALLRVLRAARLAPSGELFLRSLARPGEPGTLRRRLKDLPAGVTLRAKTGTLTGVAALSGFIDRGERQVVFVLLANGKGASRRLLDRLARAIAAHLP